MFAQYPICLAFSAYLVVSPLAPQAATAGLGVRAPFAAYYLAVIGGRHCACARRREQTLVAGCACSAIIDGGGGAATICVGEYAGAGIRNTSCQEYGIRRVRNTMPVLGTAQVFRTGCSSPAPRISAPYSSSQDPATPASDLESKQEGK